MPKPKPPMLPMADAAVAAALEPLLADLVALSLQAKQAHWNVKGPRFLPLHGMYDAIAGEYRDWADLVAERMLALGEPADGRLVTVAKESRVDEMPEGMIPDVETVALLHSRAEGLAARARGDLDRLGELDPVTQDMVIGIIAGLEKQAWMLRVQGR